MFSLSLTLSFLAPAHHCEVLRVLVGPVLKPMGISLPAIVHLSCPTLLLYSILEECQFTLKYHYHLTVFAVDMLARGSTGTKNAKHYPAVAIISSTHQQLATPSLETYDTLFVNL